VSVCKHFSHFLANTATNFTYLNMLTLYQRFVCQLWLKRAKNSKQTEYWLRTLQTSHTLSFWYLGRHHATA